MEEHGQKSHENKYAYIVHDDPCIKISDPAQLFHRLPLILYILHAYG